MFAEKIKLNIDGREVTGFAGQSILEVATENGINIPTLCNDERVKVYGSCGVCVVEVENVPKLLRACSTSISNGMIIRTSSERVSASRKVALELLISDHKGDCRPPCLIACPGHTDCQGYVGLIANGEHKAALRLIKDKIPLPASIGRVCPHPCEEACRRELVEEPISIAELKRFAADLDLEDTDTYMPEIKPDTGKTVAIIGGGPGGLSAAYFLRTEGHDVTVYDKMPRMGGMLRYGIPEYRLPKAVLDKEIAIMEKMGIKMRGDIQIGKDVTLEYLRAKYSAVILAVGAWSSMKMGVTGEDLNGVVGGIDFLRAAALNEPFALGKKVAIVGGGNTAMDACRTAVRLGASEVYVVYRRTKAEMPAEEIEIQEAGEEGVIFKYLTNPIEIIADEATGRVSKMRLQKMQLGEPDASGRRSPVAIKGAEEMLAVDTVIIAIGQGLDATGLLGEHGGEAVGLTKRKTIAADELSFETNLSGVFAIGDATNKGASIAIEAIGEAKKAASVINEYLLTGKKPTGAKDLFYVTDKKTPEDFASRPKIARERPCHQAADARRKNFGEVSHGITKEQAVKEAGRCLECGCADYFECKLIDYSNKLGVKGDLYTGEKHNSPPDVSNPFFYRNPNKCILCGLCVRVCDEVMGRTALGLVNRGFDAEVKPSLGTPIVETDCISCGQCVTLCPTGALGELLPIKKRVPLNEQLTESTCSFCSVGCKTRLATSSGMLTRVLPADDGLLCVRGRFGFSQYGKAQRLKKPLMKKNDKLCETSYDEAFVAVNKRMQIIAAQNGSGSIGVSISDKLTNEEIATIRQYARGVLKTDNVFTFNGTGSDVTASCSFSELENTEVIVLVCNDIVNSHTIAGIKIKKAVENGAKLILMSNLQTQADEWAAVKLPATEQSLGVLAGAVAGDVATLADVADEAIKQAINQAVELYVKAKKAIIVFDEKLMTGSGAAVLKDMAVRTGHYNKPRCGLLPLKQNCNSAGLFAAGVDCDSMRYEKMLTADKLKGLIIFGEDVPHLDLSGLEFLAVQDYFLTETAEKADVVIPAATPFESEGTYLSADMAVKYVNPALTSTIGKSNVEIVTALAEAAGVGFVCAKVSDGSKQLRYDAADGSLFAKDMTNTHNCYAKFNAYLERSGLMK